MIANDKLGRITLAWPFRQGVFSLAAFLAVVGPVLTSNPFVVFASDWRAQSLPSIPYSDPEDGTSETAKYISFADPIGLRSRRVTCETAEKAGGSACHRHAGVTKEFKPITISTYSYHNGHGGPLRC